jgi:hypothetical protein
MIFVMEGFLPEASEVKERGQKIHFGLWKSKNLEGWQVDWFGDEI